MSDFIPDKEAFQAASYAIDAIDLATAPYVPIESYRPTVGRARDRLRVVCEEFDARGYAVTEEEVYLQLFDALAFLTDALRVLPIEEKQLARAKMSLSYVLHLAVTF